MTSFVVALLLGAGCGCVARALRASRRSIRRRRPRPRVGLARPHARVLRFDALRVFKRYKRMRDLELQRELERRTEVWRALGWCAFAALAFLLAGQLARC